MLDTLRDNDPLPVRTDRNLNNIIRTVAADTDATLIDVDKLAREAGGGLEPVAWFLDHNHLTVEGHDALARMVAEAVAPLVGLAPPDWHLHQRPAVTWLDAGEKDAANNAIFAPSSNLNSNGVEDDLEWRDDCRVTLAVSTQRCRTIHLSILSSMSMLLCRGG